MIRFVHGSAVAVALAMLAAAAAGDVAEEARALLAAGEVREGLARMEAGLKALEAGADPAEAYWEMWKLAGLRAPGIPAERHYDWMRRTYARLMQCPADDVRWVTSHRINAVEMACELETAATKLGLYGEAFLALRQAETHAHALWNGEPRPDRMRGGTPDMIGATVALFLDRASHLERQGRTDDAEGAYKLACETADLVPKTPGQGRRALNNRAAFLGRIGRNLEADSLYARAKALSAESGDSAHPEVNSLHRLAETEGPSDAIIEKLLAHAARFREEGRVGDALGILRRCATLRFRQGRPAEAWKLFADVERDAARLKLREPATECAYWRAKARSEAGLYEEAEADFVSALNLYREAGMKPAEEKLYCAYARHLDQRGRLAEALDAIRESLRLNRMMHLPYLLPDRLAVLARLLAKAGRPAEAEAAWQEALAVMGTLDQMEPGDRLDLQIQRLAFLRRAGRKAETLALLSEARKRADDARLSPYERQDLDGFDPSQAPDGAAPAVTADAVPDIQPRYVAARSLPGGNARAWFWLLNPGTATVDGSLLISGRGVMTLETLPAAASAHAAPGDADSTTSAPVRVVAGSAYPVCAEAAGDTARPARILVAWHGAAAVTSIWDVASDADALGSRATIHASLSLWNPFFSVPVYHEIGTPSPGAAAVNLRIRASAPCRVEIYDAARTRMAGIDATGDGSFLGAGDVLASDEDADGTPDVASGTPVWVRVFPSPGVRYGKALDLALEVRTGKVWTVAGHDRLLGFGVPVKAGRKATATPPDPGG